MVVEHKQKKNEIRKWIFRLKDLPTTVVVELLAETLTAIHDKIKNGGESLFEKPVFEEPISVDKKIEETKKYLQQLELEKTSPKQLGEVLVLLSKLQVLLEETYKVSVEIKRKLKEVSK